MEVRLPFKFECYSSHSQIDTERIYMKNVNQRMKAHYDEMCDALAELSDKCAEGVVVSLATKGGKSSTFYDYWSVRREWGAYTDKQDKKPDNHVHLMGY